MEVVGSPKTEVCAANSSCTGKAVDLKVVSLLFMALYSFGCLINVRLSSVMC